MAKKKKLPKQLAILDEDLCTGCEACVTVCPVDCIPFNPDYPETQEQLLDKYNHLMGSD